VIIRSRSPGSKTTVDEFELKFSWIGTSECIPESELEMNSFRNDKIRSQFRSWLAQHSRPQLLPCFVVVFSFFECLPQCPFHCVTKWLLSLCTSRDA
jgi:hypothetical protein